MGGGQTYNLILLLTPLDYSASANSQFFEKQPNFVTITNEIKENIGMYFKMLK